MDIADETRPLIVLIEEGDRTIEFTIPVAKRGKDSVVDFRGAVAKNAATNEPIHDRPITIKEFEGYINAINGWGK